MTMRAVLFAFALVVGLPSIGSAPASAQGLQFFAVLLGGNEVNMTTGEADAGDKNGYGAAYVVLTESELCYAIVVHNIGNPTAAHIHAARAGINGGIFIPLDPPASGDSGHISDCIPATSNQRNQLRNKTNKFYINVHNNAFPNGALRGQLN